MGHYRVFYSEKIQDKMLDVGFDSVTVSVHAFTLETYQIMQAGNLEKVKTNLTRLMSEKKRKGLRAPYVTVVFALNKVNVEEAVSMLDWVHGLGVNSFYIYHFHDYTEKLKSLIFDIAEYEAINKKIDALYDHAKKINALSLLPEKRPYFTDPVLREEEKSEIKCYQPWTGFQLRSCFSHKDSYYLGCCNVFNAFILNYQEHIYKYGKIEFDKIWNHPVLQYLRSTVNSVNGRERNALCKYCQSKERDYFKKADRLKNYEYKLRAIDEFFDGYRQQFPHEEEISGLQILFTEDAELRANVF